MREIDNRWLICLVAASLLLLLLRLSLTFTSWARSTLSMDLSDKIVVDIDEYVTDDEEGFQGTNGEQQTMMSSRGFEVDDASDRALEAESAFDMMEAAEIQPDADQQQARQHPGEHQEQQEEEELPLAKYKCVRYSRALDMELDGLLTHSRLGDGYHRAPKTRAQRAPASGAASRKRRVPSTSGGANTPLRSSSGGAAPGRRAASERGAPPRMPKLTGRWLRERHGVAHSEAYLAMLDSSRRECIDYASDDDEYTLVPLDDGVALHRPPRKYLRSSTLDDNAFLSGSSDTLEGRIAADSFMSHWLAEREEENGGSGSRSGSRNRSSSSVHEMLADDDDDDNDDSEVRYLSVRRSWR